MQYTDFDEIEEIGSGDYGTVHTAKYKKYSVARHKRLDNHTANRMKYSEEEEGLPEVVVLKRFKYSDQTLELFITEVSNF